MIVDNWYHTVVRVVSLPCWKFRLRKKQKLYFKLFHISILIMRKLMFETLSKLCFAMQHHNSLIAPDKGKRKNSKNDVTSHLYKLKHHFQNSLSQISLSFYLLTWNRFHCVAAAAPYVLSLSLSLSRARSFNCVLLWSHFSASLCARLSVKTASRIGNFILLFFTILRFLLRITIMAPSFLSSLSEDFISVNNVCKFKDLCRMRGENGFILFGRFFVPLNGASLCWFNYITPRCG